MQRILNSSTMSMCRNVVYCYEFRSFQSNRYKRNPYLFMGDVLYSTLPRQKIYLDLSHSKQKNIKTKLKVKPYEELLRVLEVRERTLKNKIKQSQLVESPSTKETSSLHVQVGLTPANCDTEKSEGIFTIKAPPSKKKSKCTTDNAKTEKQKKKTSKKLTSSQQTLLQAQLDKAAKMAHAMRTLKSYIEVSVNADEVEKAHQALDYYKIRHKLQQMSESPISVEMYNLLIFGWAQKGRVDKVRQIFSALTKENIQPNLQSYAGYLECVARSKFVDVPEIQHVVNEMKSKNLSHRDIPEKCTFVSDQKEKILQALGFVDAEYRPNPSFTCEIYSCKLLQNLNDKSHAQRSRHLDFGFKIEDIPKLSSSQMNMESKYSIKIKSVDALTTVADKVKKSRTYLKECEDLWRRKLTTALKNIKNMEKKAHGIHRPSIYPYLSVIETEILVDLLLQEIRLLAETGEFFSPNVKVLYKTLGLKVMNHYFIWLNKKNDISDKVLLIYQKYMEYLLNPKLFSEYSPREYWEYLKKEYSNGPTIDMSDTAWPPSVVTYIGRYFYDILRYNIAFNANSVRHKTPSKVMSQAFYTAYEGMDVKLSKQIRTHSLLCKLYRDAKLDHLEFDASLVPMVTPPRPWVKHNAGGLLITTTPFIRFPAQAVHQSAHYGNVPSKELHPCFDSLNSLSLCPWIINKPVLDLVIDVFRKGGSEELDIPLNPNNLPLPPKVLGSMSKREKAIVRRQKMDMKKLKCETTSLWFDCLYKLSIANHFRDRVFWFPHNLDFRGRVYPTPPHFNHLGSDMARSILLFAEGQPLGPKGLDWLKIHLINLTGFKKRDPHADRLKFANEIIPEILDSAEKPFEGRQWWKTSDKPWQTLACCKEIADALRHANPAEFVSHFPVHQDGSCNGLQHYAALGRDELGAIEVNLHPSTAPHDVYSGVAALVEKERLRDAANGSEVAQALEGFVRRKVVKQTVMTFVYGVTNYGAKLQILKQLKDIPGFPERYHHEGATYLMKKTFLSIGEMFTATRQIQDWFTECAEQITRVSGDTLEWITPLGLPVIQPYHKEVSVRPSKYCLSQGTENSHYASTYEPHQLPNIRKQKNAFAPNFIHSLDSSHMMLTSLYSLRLGFTFVSVHDCYWTHSSTVEIMNEVCREQFVALHKEPILENLSVFFLDKYARVADENIQMNKTWEKSARLKLRDVLSRVPERGTFELDKVLDSEYFFS